MSALGLVTKRTFQRRRHRHHHDPPPRPDAFDCFVVNQVGSDRAQLRGRFTIDDPPVELHHRIDEHGMVTAGWFER
jgi:hypothetical protein